jgi:MFS family permease
MVRVEQEHASPNPFRNPSYRWLYVATLHWNFARWMEMLVVGWLAFALTGSAWDVALIGFFRNAPSLLFGLTGGLMADRLERKHILLTTQVLNVATTALVGILVVTHALQFWQLAAANVVLGSTWVFDWPARRALLPDMVDRRSVMRAFAFDNLNMNLSRIVGPLLGGVLVASVGIAGCYFALFLLYVCATATLLPIHAPSHRFQLATSNVFSHLGAGLRAVSASQAIMGVLLITVAMNFFAFPYQQILPVFTVQVLHAGASELGALGAVGGAGSLLGATLMIWYGQQPQVQGWLFIVGSACMSVALVLFATSNSFGLCLLFLTLSGFGQAAFGSLQSTIIVTHVAPELRGRAMGVLALAIGSSPFGALLIGAVANAAGPSVGIGACAAACLICVVLTAVFVPGLRDTQRQERKTRSEVGRPTEASTRG